MKKCISSFLLIICIMITAINYSVSAADTQAAEYFDENFGYELYQNAEGVNCAAVKYCISTENTFTVPDSVVWNGNSYKVARIDEYCFGDASPVNVTLPLGMDTIGKNAFFECKTLEKVILPESIISIEDWSFGCCNSLKDISVSGRNVIIGEWAFCDCTALASADLSGAVSLGANAFNGCSSLTSVVLSSDMKSIGEKAFFSCYNLTDIYFEGTQDEWNAIQIGADNDYFTKAVVHFTNGEGEGDSSVTTTVSDSQPITTTITSATVTTAPGTTTDPVTTTVTTTTVSENVSGDANGDGKVNVRDAAFIAQKLAQGKSDELPAQSDFNGDGKINVRDAAAIAKFLATGK